MGCRNSFIDTISNCMTSIRVNALLVPATPYTWLITDKFGNQYTGESITDGAGFFDIAVGDLPDGFFTAYSGEFKLEILDGNCRKIDFKMAKYYDSIAFAATAGPRVKDNLGCDFDCQTTGGGPGNSAVFPFEDVENVVIPWTALLKNLYGGQPDVNVYQEIAPGEYQKVSVAITMVGGPYDLTEIDVDNGGSATGYVLVG